MNHEDVIIAEANRFADVLATADPHAQCPTCPDWNSADLLWHLTGVHQFWAAVLGRNVRTNEQAEELESEEEPQPSAISAMLPVREVATEALVNQLGRLGDAEPRWTWWEPEQTVGFTRRMQVLKVITTDPHAVRDFEAFARQTGNTLEAQHDQGASVAHFLRRR